MINLLRNISIRLSVTRMKKQTTTIIIVLIVASITLAALFFSWNPENKTVSERSDSSGTASPDEKKPHLATDNDIETPSSDKESGSEGSNTERSTGAIKATSKSLTQEVPAIGPKPHTPGLSILTNRNSPNRITPDFRVR